MSETVVRNGLAGWLKNDLAPGTDQRALLQEIIEQTEIEVIPDADDLDPDTGKPREPWKDQLGDVIGAIDRRLVRVEKRPAGEVVMTPEDRSAIAAEVREGIMAELGPLFELAERLKD